MRACPIWLSFLLLSMGGATFAQEWTEFVSKDDLFSTNFPGTPQITQSTYRSQFGADLPSRCVQASPARVAFR